METLKKLISLSLIIITISCKENKNDEPINDNDITITDKKDSIMEFNINEIKKQIEIQKNVENEEDEIDNPYYLTSKDLELASLLIDKDLKNNGFKKIENSKFKEKILAIFNVNLDKKCKEYNVNDKFTTLFGSKMDGNTKTLLDNQYDLFSNTQNYFISNENYFLFNMILLKNIITINNDNTFKLNVSKNIIAQNKYLFNDSKADFAWLRFNDLPFLETLVKTFGYVADKDLSKLVLDNNLKDNEEFGKVIWNKDCDGKLHFHHEIMEIIQSLPKKEQEKYFETIKNYLEYLTTQDDNRKTIDLGLTPSQRIEMMSKLAYYGTKIAKENVFYYYRFFPYVEGEEPQKEFDKNNYYNIKDFKEIYEETRNGGIAVSGQE